MRIRYSPKQIATVVVVAIVAFGSGYCALVLLQDPTRDSVRALLGVVSMFIAFLAFVWLGHVARDAGLEHASPADKSAEILADYIARAGRRVVIMDGGDEPYWENGAHVAAIRELARGEEEVEVVVIIGPDDGSGTGTIEALADEHAISLYRIPIYPSCHFSVIDGRDWLMQHPHPAGQDVEMSRGRRKTWIAAADLERAFDAILVHATQY